MDAEQVARTIEQLEFHLLKEQKDSNDPYALALVRHAMVRNRWPSEK
jgi:hypothetical protein